MEHLNHHTYRYWRISSLCLSLSIMSVLAGMTTTSFGGRGDLDSTFSGDGKLTDWVGAARGVALQPDGKIIVAGGDADNSAFAVARYNSDGSPDTGFGGGDGRVTTDIGFSNEGVNAVALQSDGKIVAVGTTWDGGGSQWGHFSLVRYNPDGSLDLTFGGGDGIVVTESLGTGWVAANSVAIQSDGKIVAAGRTDYLLYDFPELTVIRYNPDGSLDLPFGGGGGKARIPWGYAPPVEDATSVAIQPDGRIVAAGYSYGFWDFSALVRFDSNGSLDQTFGGGDGVVQTDIGPRADVAHSAVIQSDGKIVTAGYSYNGLNNDFALVRYNSNGSLDTTFDSDGKVITPIGSGSSVVQAVAAQSDGKVLVAGYANNGLNDDFALARYNPNGSLDTTFGGGDGVTAVDFNNSNDLAYGMVIDGQGRAVVVGESGGMFAIARFLLEPNKAHFDFDGDGRSDVSVYRPSDSTWWIDHSSQGVSAIQFGVSTDRITPADYDGDGKTDIAIYRNGVWWRINSSNFAVSVVHFGLAGDLPLPADYTGDGRDEIAIFRGGEWWMLDLSNGQSSSFNFGLPGDKPVPADYDGDGLVDRAIYRNGEWHLNRSSRGYAVASFGLSSDRPVAGDYDGDGKTDLAVYRDGTWYLLQSSQGFAAFQFGISTDTPTPADFDGDGKTDAAVFRSGIWYVIKSTGGISIQQFGFADDKPVQAAFAN